MRFVMLHNKFCNIHIAIILYYVYLFAIAMATISIAILNHTATLWAIHAN